MPENTASVGEVVPIVKPHQSYVNVDPETAKRWLARNTNNRNLREASINQYANDMVAGRWTDSNDSICFATDGTLLNGQHRLHAVIKSVCTITMSVKRNMPADSMLNMDRNKGRTAADALQLVDGERSAHLLAAASKLAIVYSDDRIYKDTKLQAVSQGEIRDFIADNPEIRDSVTLTNGIKSKIDAAPSVLAVAHWIIARRAGSAVADHYLAQLANRVGEPEGSAVHAVDSRLRNLRYKRAQYSQRAYLSLLIKGWNHYARDSRVSSLTVQSTGKIPEPVGWQR